jgi:hypothetical protein
MEHVYDPVFSEQKDFQKVIMDELLRGVATVSSARRARPEPR